MRIFALVCVTVGLAFVVLSIAIATAWAPVAKAECSYWNVAACYHEPIRWGEVLFGLGMAAFGLLLLALRPHKKNR